MTASWTGPDSRRTALGSAVSRPYERVEPVSPSLSQDLRAGLLTVAVTVLVGAPVGLLWALVAPLVDVVVTGQQVSYADPYGDGLIAVDGYFLAAVAVAGLVGGLLAWWFGHRHGPAVVVALAVGGLGAAYVAQVVGEQYSLEVLREAVRAGGDGRYRLFLELQSPQLVVGWPVMSLLGYLVVSLLRGR